MPKEHREEYEGIAEEESMILAVLFANSVGNVLIERFATQIRIVFSSSFSSISQLLLVNSF